jgi:hypothetical protein
MDELSLIDEVSSNRNGTLKLFQYAASAASIRMPITASPGQPAAEPWASVAFVVLGARLMGERMLGHIRSMAKPILPQHAAKRSSGNPVTD